VAVFDKADLVQKKLNLVQKTPILICSSFNR
jgi:hypothetical protein